MTHVRTLARTLGSAILCIATPALGQDGTAPIAQTQAGQIQAIQMVPARMARLAIVPDADLANLHGGFDWGGMSITFGADIRTYLNGELALQTLVNWAPTGAMTQTSVAPTLTTASADQLRASFGGISLASLARGNPVYFSTNGQTAIIQAANGTLQNVLVNTASTVNAGQQTNATIGLANYAAFASALRSGALISTIGRDVATFSR